MKSHGIAGGHAERQRVGIGQSNVFDGHANHAARDVERILSRFEHATEPIQSGVGIAVAHGFVQRRDQVVVLFARLVVKQDAFLQRITHDLVCDLASAFGILVRQPGRDFQHVIGAAGVATGVARDQSQRIVGRGRDSSRPSPRSLSASARRSKSTICSSVSGCRT